MDGWMDWIVACGLLRLVEHLWLLKVMSGILAK